MGTIRNLWVIAVSAVAAALMVGVAIVPAASASEGCPNEARRVEQGSTFLADCRAYELVSPPDLTPYMSEREHTVEGVRASSVGGGIAWFSLYPLSTSLGGGFYDLSTRQATGWVTESVSPRLSTRNSELAACPGGVYFSTDLSKGVLVDGKSTAGVSHGSEGGECGSNDPSLVENEPEGAQNLFLRDNITGLYKLVDLTPAGVAPADAILQGASDDFSHVIFEDGAKLTADAPPGATLYEWAGGAVSLVTVLPDGKPTTGTLPGVVVVAPETHQVSADGTRVVFQSEGRLYMRKNLGQEQSALGSKDECLEAAKACTVQLDASRNGGPGGGGSFLAANASASDTKVFFTDGAEAGLTADTVEGSGQNLYEYESVTGELKDLTPAGNLGLYGLTGVSKDGSYLYLVAEAALDGAAVPGSPNLYVLHEGALGFIATLSLGDENDWRREWSTSRVSASGRYLAFDSSLSLTGYDNRDAVTGGSDGEIYLYDASREVLSCASCDPNGARPTASVGIALPDRSSELETPDYLQRQLSDEGQVFFNTANPLLASAVNGKANVYEYFEGKVSLISSGSSEADSFFYDASPNGEDVYFLTTQHLVRGDPANGLRLYDARVGGGFPEAEASPVPCSGEECRNPVVGTPVLAPPVSVGFQGAGNFQSVSSTKSSVKALTRKQKLNRALSRCRREKNRRKRTACIRKAHRTYGKGR